MASTIFLLCNCQRPDFYEAEEYHQEYYKKNKLHYKAYRRGSGRASFLEKIWTQDNINKLNEILSKLQ